MWTESQISVWIEAIGTVLSAIGSTPSHVLSDAMLNDLNVIGLALQAIGSSLIPQNQDYLFIVGSQLEAIGNLVSLQAEFIENENVSSVLGSQGDLIEAVGGALTIDFTGNQSIQNALNNLGDVIQVVGAAYQALSVRYPPNSLKNQEINTVGSWIQAVGAVLSAIFVEA
ncbi:hypothetical protein MKX96_10345 [Psychrobacillus sp. FSL W7-1493]|uniref:DUF6944 family repetitive protein n=1 Tax=Psychrobacillus sp. FSL W7-1493 TaxID=2921552 RepID=UPI0030FB7D1C